MSRWRHALAVEGFFALVAGNIRAPAAAQPPVAITITAQPITSFDLRDSSRRQFGLLEFRGGLVLRSSFKHFGGISAIRVVPNGTNFIALSDKGWWLRGHILYDGPRPIAIADAEMAPMLGPDGRPLAARGWYDTESIAQDGGTLYVGIERVHQIVRFNYEKDGLLARGYPIALPSAVRSCTRGEGPISHRALTSTPPQRKFVNQKALVDYAERNGLVYLWAGPERRPSPFTKRQQMLSSDQYEIVDVRTSRGGVRRAMLFPKAILEAEFEANREVLAIKRERWRAKRWRIVTLRLTPEKSLKSLRGQLPTRNDREMMSTRLMLRGTMFASNSLYAAAIAVVAGCCAWKSNAQDATWLLKPASGDWNTASNWNPPTVPSGTATFGASNTTSIVIGASSISSILFNAGAPAYTFTDRNVFTINGPGIINNSSFAPTFINDDFLSFVNSSTAGNATITGGGGLQFSDTSTAGNASINYLGIFNFFNTSTAGSAVITSGYITQFYDSSTAGKATITNNSYVIFNNASSAGRASIVNNDLLQFFGTSTAGSATIYE